MRWPILHLVTRLPERCALWHDYHMATFLYFAYGSNLLSHRLIARCSSARIVSIAKCVDYSVNFTKLSHRDGSGKASLNKAIGAVAHGVVFEIERKERATLDWFEGAGLGYDRVDDLCVCLSDGKETLVSTYLGTDPRPDLRPFDWYLALILAGAAEHALDPTHTATLRASRFTPDPIACRETRLAAINALSAAGHHKWLDLLPGTD